MTGREAAILSANVWWKDKVDAAGVPLGHFVCNRCGATIKDKQGTSLVTGRIHCKLCTEELFTSLHQVSVPVSPAIPIRPINSGLKNFWVVSIVSGLILGYLLTFAGTVNIREDFGPIVLLVGLALFAYGFVMECVVLHRMWTTIQYGRPRATPNKAIGFLFIPFFNWYWVFQAFWGWAVDYNRSAKECGLDLPQAPEGLALAVSILILLSGLPVVGIVCFVLLGIFFAKSINCVNALAARFAPGAPLNDARGQVQSKRKSSARPTLQIGFAGISYALAMLSVASGAFWYFEGWRGDEDTIALFVIAGVLGLCGAALYAWFLRDRAKGWALCVSVPAAILLVVVIAGSWIGRTIVVRESRAFRATAAVNARLEDRAFANVIPGAALDGSSGAAELRAVLDRALVGCPKGSVRELVAVVYFPVKGEPSLLWKGPPFKQIGVRQPFERAIVAALAGKPSALAEINAQDFLGEEPNYFWLHVVRDTDKRLVAAVRLGSVRSGVSTYNEFMF